MSPLWTRLVLMMLIFFTQESFQRSTKNKKQSKTEISGEGPSSAANKTDIGKETARQSKASSEWHRTPSNKHNTNTPHSGRKISLKINKKLHSLKRVKSGLSTGAKRKNVFQRFSPKRSGRIGNYLVSPMDKAQLDLIHNIYNSFPLKSPGEDQERLNTEQNPWMPTTPMHSSQNYHHTGFQMHHVPPTLDVYTEGNNQAFPYASSNPNEGDDNEEQDSHPATTYTPAQYEDMLQSMHPKLTRPTEHLHAVNQGKIHNLLFNIAYNGKQKPITKPMKLTPAEWQEFSNILHSYMSKSYNPAAIFDRPQQPSEPENPAPSLFTGSQDEETGEDEFDDRTSRHEKAIHLYGEPPPQLLSKLLRPTTAGKRKLSKKKSSPKKKKTTS